MSEAPGTRHNVVLLSSGFALAVTGSAMLATVSALIGHALADDKSMATVPMALMWLGTALATVPASFLMRRMGRRAGFIIGAAIGVVGSLISGVALSRESFALFCVGITVIGAANGFFYYFRFAAAEVASVDYRSRAIAFVMAGGVLGGFLGPLISMGSNAVLASVPYLGPILSIGVLSLIILVLATRIKIPKPSAVALRGGRPIYEIAVQPAFMVAVAGAAVAYGVMILLMSVTPLAMVGMNHSYNDAAIIIQSHVLAMYGPSFFTGRLIRRFGVTTIMSWGALAMIAGALLALTGTSLPIFWCALVLLGLGWNFLFIGATTLLTETYTVAERAKTQAFNEFMVFGVSGVMSLLAGLLHHAVGWHILNILALPPLIAVLFATMWLARRRRGRLGTETAAE